MPGPSTGVALLLVASGLHVPGGDFCYPACSSLWQQPWFPTTKRRQFGKKSFRFLFGLPSPRHRTTRKQRKWLANRPLSAMTFTANPFQVGENCLHRRLDPFSSSNFFLRSRPRIINVLFHRSFPPTLSPSLPLNPHSFLGYPLSSKTQYGRCTGNKYIIFWSTLPFFSLPAWSLIWPPPWGLFPMAIENKLKYVGSLTYRQS